MEDQRAADEAQRASQGGARATLTIEQMGNGEIVTIVKYEVSTGHEMRPHYDAGILAHAALNYAMQKVAQHLEPTTQERILTADEAREMDETGVRPVLERLDAERHDGLLVPTVNAQTGDSAWERQRYSDDPGMKRDQLSRRAMEGFLAMMTPDRQIAYRKQAIAAMGARLVKDWIDLAAWCQQVIHGQDLLPAFVPIDPGSAIRRLLGIGIPSNLDGPKILEKLKRGDEQEGSGIVSASGAPLQ